MEAMMDRKIGAAKDEILDTVDREIIDIAETNRAFLEKLDNHEHRIDRLELKTGLATINN